jgi:hypothetical protein
MEKWLAWKRTICKHVVTSIKITMDVFEEFAHNMFVLKGSCFERELIVLMRHGKRDNSGFERVSLHMEKFWMVNPNELPKC